LDENKLDDAINWPLYLAAMLVMWCAAGEVNTVIDSPQLTLTLDIISSFGCLFSIAWRSLKIDKRYINIIALASAGTIAFGYYRGSIDSQSFIPADLGESDMVVAILILWISAIRTWMLVTDSATLFTVVLALAIAGLTGAYNVNTDYIFIFSFQCILSLYMVMTASSSIYRTQSARISTALHTIHIGFAVFIAMVSILAGYALGIPLKAISANISLEKAMRGILVSTINNAGNRLNTVNFSDSDKMSIGSGGGDYTDDVMVVMKAYPSDKQPHYLRGRTYDHYTTRGWISSFSNMSPLILVRINNLGTQNRIYSVRQDPQIEGIVPKSAAKEKYQIRIQMLAGRTNTLYTPLNTRKIEFSTIAPIGLRQLCQSADNFIGFDSTASDLEYASQVEENLPTNSQIKDAKLRNVSALIRERYIDDHGDGDVSQTDQARLRETAQKIVGSLPPSHRSLSDQAEAIRSWVAAQCDYSLAAPATPKGQDPVSYFLFVSQRGYCDLFASSMVILCRYAGIPARIATGFAPGEQSADLSYSVRAKDKHAWVEVFFPGVGWREYDPTSGANDAPKADKQTGMRQEGQILLSWLRLMLNVNGPAPIALFVIIVACLSYVAKTELFDRYFKNRKKEAYRRTDFSMSEEIDESDIQEARHAAVSRWKIACDLLQPLGLSESQFETPSSYIANLRRFIYKKQRDSEQALQSEFLNAVELLGEDAQTAAYAPNQEAKSLINHERISKSETALNIIKHGVKTYKQTRKKLVDATKT